MKWKEITLTTSHEAADAGANIFFEVGSQGVVIEDPYVLNRYILEDRWDYYDIPLDTVPEDVVAIKGYLPLDERFPSRMKSFKEKLQRLRECFSQSPAEVDLTDLTEENWTSSWKQYYKTFKIGDKIVVKPVWERYSPDQGEILVEMDPGAAFGTGTHATTIMCIQLLEKYMVPGQIVFDVGCGSGILSVVASKLGAGFVVARDINGEAVHASLNNAVINGITGGMEVAFGNYLDDVSGKAHLIVCNIVSDAIIEFSPQAFEKLLPGGKFLVSGIILQRIEEVKAQIVAAGFSLLDTLVQGEWVAIAAEKR